MKKFEDILARCIDDIKAGRSSVEECLDRHRSLRARLEPLLNIALGIPEMPDVRPSTAFRIKARVQLMDEISLRQTVTKRRWSRYDSQLRPMPLKRRFSMVGVVIAIVLALSAAAGGTAYASQGSLPGDTLYPVKLATEQVRMALPGDDAAKAERALGFAETRIEEIEALAESDRAQHLGLAADKYDDAMDVVLARLERAANEGMVAGNVTVNLAEATARHLSLLDKIYEMVPEQAKPAIAHARNVSRTGHFRALEIITQDHPGKATELNLAAMQDRLNRAIEASQTQDTGEVSRALEQFEEMAQIGLEIAYAAWQLGDDEESYVGEMLAGATCIHLSLLDDVAERAPAEALQAIARARRESMHRHRDGLLAICEQDPAKATEINLNAMAQRLERASTRADNAEAVEIALEQFETMADLGEAIYWIADEIGGDEDKVEDLIAQATLIHVDALVEMWERVPEQARKAIEGAIARALIRHENRVHSMEQRGVVPPDHPGVPPHLRESVEERVRQQRIWDQREEALSPAVAGFSPGCPGCRR